MTAGPAGVRASGKLFFASMAAALSLFLGGCQTTDPPPAETVLWLKLNDSLSRYDLVVVQILNRQTQEVMGMLWNKPLPNPAKDIPGYPLKSLANQPFIVKVTGYKAMGQLALETLIYYESGKKSVLHTDLPPLRPVNGLVKLVPSTGTMSPAFNRDSLEYKVTLPSGADSVSFALQAENPAAVISFGGATVASGASAPKRAVGTSPDTVKVMVTDLSTGTAATRTYTLVLFPTPPPGLYLSGIKPTFGSLFPDFTPESQIYTLHLPSNVDTVAFFLTPADASTMTMTINQKAIFPGAKSEVFKIEKNLAYPIQIFVFRGSEMSFYQVTITRDD
ncbi:MAG TPA: cadherin-like beta sandwich domain-containing protein [Fibrobacteria bacterium]|nr:cadherin-like beta sandwich domain-containing protein [Fibrobacteria bacterium]